MKFNFILLFVAVSTLFVACKEDAVEVPNVPIGNGVLVLNQGKYKSNNSSLTYRDKDTKTVTQDVFAINNQRNLGDTGQDIILYGSKIYVTVYGSSILEVIDAKTGVSKKTIPLVNDAGAPRSPRSLTSYNGKVYITLFDGHVAQFDTTSLTIEKTIAVGPNPEGIVAANNLLYVAISGGMAVVNDSTVAVIDPISFTKLRNIKVVINPSKLVADSHGDVYVISNGNYFDIFSTLQRIEVGTEKATVITGFTPYNMTINKDLLYIYSYEYDKNYNVVNKKYIKYDAIAETIVSQSFISSDAINEVPYSIDVNPTSGDIYIAESDYVNNGKMYVFSKDGVAKESFAVGLNASKTIFTTNK